MVIHSVNFTSKYLPRRFDEFQMDIRVIQLLNRLIVCDSLNILLVSRTGCGKTSLINSIVRTYYNNNPKSHENILVVNSVKEQGVAFYRGDVKTFCQSLPTIPGKKRVVILDDLDLLNEQSQQMFRTCIDNYNRTVHFIASCSDTQKVIESIQSRLISIKIPILNDKNLENIAKKIINNENIKITHDALKHMILVSHGSARSLINYLQKGWLLNKKITLQISETLCTDISWKEFETYIDYLKQDELMKATQLLYNFNNLGFSVMDILDNFFEFVKQTDVLEQDIIYKLIPIICQHLIRLHDTHSHNIELAFFTNNIIEIIPKNDIIY